MNIHIHLVSDDNSSIQSSPWQRDHNWKQTTPRKCSSKDLNFFYYRPIELILSKDSQAISKRIQRQPYSKHFDEKSIKYAKRSKSNLIESKVKKQDDDSQSVSKDLVESSKTLENQNENSVEVDTVDSSTNGDTESKPKHTNNDAHDEEDNKMEYKNDIEANATNSTNQKDENAKCNENSPTPETNRKKRLHCSTKINSVIEKLIAKASEQPQNVLCQTGPGFHFSSSATRSNDLFPPHQHVSPRKRFLREFEKVSLEDRISNTQKRSRSKSNASTDFMANSSCSSSNQSKSFAHNKDENNRIANGRQSPQKRIHSMDISYSESHLKNAKSSTTTVSATTVTSTLNSQQIPSIETPTQPVSKPISNYSIISLLRHSSSANSDNKHENNHTEDKTVNDSPRSPISYNQQSTSRSAFVSKKKSPTNCGNSLISSPVNYRNARSPDINSTSPGLQQSSHHHRYHSTLSNAASLSSPTSR